MTHKVIISIVLCLRILSANSQVVTLELKNPFPRIGEECEVEYFLKTDTTKLSDTLDYLKKMTIYNQRNLGNGSLVFSKLLKDTGFASIGPFEFFINNKKLKSGTINVYFDTALPNEKDGIWIRQKNYNGQEYLIIEQRISGEYVTTWTTKNSSTSEFKKNEEEFIEIDEINIDKKIINIAISYSTSKTQNVELNQQSILVGYKISLYKIEKTDLFKKNFKLDKTNLKYLPIRQKSFEFFVK
jgi:hypothetical protein